MRMQTSHSLTVRTRHSLAKDSASRRESWNCKSKAGLDCVCAVLQPGGEKWQQNARRRRNWLEAESKGTACERRWSRTTTRALHNINSRFRWRLSGRISRSNPFHLHPSSLCITCILNSKPVTICHPDSPARTAGNHPLSIARHISRWLVTRPHLRQVA